MVSGAAVVNGQTLSEVLALPARSFMPVEPPLIVAVYDVEDASEDEGANVVQWYHLDLMILFQGILVPALFFNLNVSGLLTVEVCIGSLNVACDFGRDWNIGSTRSLTEALVTVGRVVSAELAVIPEFEELALAPNRLVVEGLLF